MNFEAQKELRKQIVESLLIFVFGGVNQLLIWCEGCWGEWYAMSIVFSYAGFTWVLLWKGSTYLVTLLNRWVDWLKFPSRRLVATIMGVVLLVYGGTFFIHFCYHLFVYRTPYDSIFDRYDFDEHTVTLAVTLGINTIMHGRAFLLNWKKAAIDMEKMKTDQVSSQYESLKNQVNPHFLFNSLNALSSLVYDDQKKAVLFIRKLSEVYRYVLEKRDQEVVPLKDELSFLESFVFLQKIRFGDNLKVDWQGEANGGHVPPLALQILMENAIKHNVISADRPLTIKINITDTDITMENKIQPKKVTDSTGIGLTNLKARYGYLSDIPVEIEHAPSFFKVTIPILDLR